MDYSTRAQKTKRESNIDFSVSKRTTKKTKSLMRKSSIAWLAVLIVLIVGFVGGFFAHKLAFKNDTYQMIGEEVVYVGGDGDKVYAEQGVKCVAFGKDQSKDCTVTYFYRAEATDEATEVSKIDETTAGTYYAVYHTPASKFKKVSLIRTIFVLREED